MCVVCNICGHVGMGVCVGVRVRVPVSVYVNLIFRKWICLSYYMNPLGITGS